MTSCTELVVMATAAAVGPLPVLNNSRSSSRRLSSVLSATPFLGHRSNLRGLSSLVLRHNSRLHSRPRDRRHKHGVQAQLLGGDEDGAEGGSGPSWDRAKEQLGKLRQVVVEDGGRVLRSLLPLAAATVGVRVVLNGADTKLWGDPRSGGEAKQRKGKKGKLKTMPLDQRVEWLKDLPAVQESIPYTDLLRLKREGHLKHIIVHPAAKLKEQPELLLAVVQDDRVVRCTVPDAGVDAPFWEAWEGAGVGSLVMQAFTPALEEPQIPAWARAGPTLRWVRDLQTWVDGMEDRARLRAEEKKAVEEQRARKDASRRAKLQAIEEQRRERELRRKQEREERRREEGGKEVREPVAVVETRPRRGGGLTVAMQADATVSYILGVIFFVLFYVVVVVGVKKQKKDYDDREKIRLAEEEERRKMADWEREQEEAEVVAKELALEGLTDAEKEKKIEEESAKNPALAAGLKFMKSGARVRRAKGRRPPQYMDTGVDVKFSDVAGLGEIRRELEEIVDFFKYGERYRRRGSKIPAGILLCGPPGTGKTLLAKAVAGEADVNFFSISASQFVEIYVGVGASRVRALYQEARENAPAVVFIDELDAVGRQRGMSEGSGTKERDATLNQLLTCLDGFDGRGGVITIAATNRPDILDTALVRPGRFDRKIIIPKPSARGRAEILKVHARNKPTAEDMDYIQIAEMTNGMVGAQLANLLDLSALMVLRAGRDEITTDDVLEAVRLEEAGFTDERERSPETLRKLALQEAAMVAVAANFRDFRDIQLISITPRMGEEKGSARLRADQGRWQHQSMGRRTGKEYITIQLAGRAADELWNGKDNLTTIWADTVDIARKMAREIVWTGLSLRPNMYALTDCWLSPEQVEGVDEEALEILNECYERAKQYLSRNRPLVEALVERLMETRSLGGTEFQRIVAEHAVLDPEPPTAVQIREARSAAFMERMIAEKRSSRQALVGVSSGPTVRE